MQTLPKVTTRDRTEAPQEIPEASANLSLGLDAPRPRPPWRVRHARLLFSAGAAVLVCLLGTATFLTWRTLGGTPLDEIMVRTAPSEEPDVPTSPPSRRSTSGTATVVPAAPSVRPTTAGLPKTGSIKPAEPALPPRPRTTGTVTHTRPDIAETRGSLPAATPTDRARVGEQPPLSAQPASNCTEAVAALNLCPRTQTGASR